ncbi:hypothetical protein POX_a00190 [Penicillium oxalicum]|uniref:hypothetical protein n=1 Tax=Penicillium oxalicum TaxID=69781 RepID=UPI0020B72A49|nr:hypothetical protein POX_a00190 [Penicillium oxalicum]KAI2793609.1 hypothetical protein POX_a00190 [Penicillium oxalicum]
MTPIFSRSFSVPLRISEIAFAAIHAASAHVHQETTKQEFGSPEAGRDVHRTQFAKMALS